MAENKVLGVITEEERAEMAEMKNQVKAALDKWIELKELNENNRRKWWDKVMARLGITNYMHLTLDELTGEIKEEGPCGCGSIGEMLSQLFPNIKKGN